ncbi:MAG: hypothetical protein EBS38_08550 [Actinobacteria bacterium]|nr:hypothetical protein [Actinomycetota bacterium]
MPKGSHPNSRKNLTLGGRTPDWGSSKRRRYLTVTDDGFEGALRLARSLGCSSVSDLLEELGRGRLKCDRN